MAQSYTGHCFCGELEFTAKAEPETVLCHCNTCKGLSGAPFTLNQIIPKGDFKVTKGEPRTYTYYGDSGKPVHCYFCANCGTHVAHEQAVLGDKIILRTGLVKGGDSFKPVLEIYGKDRAKWQPEVAKTLEAGP